MRKPIGQKRSLCGKRGSCCLCHEYLPSPTVEVEDPACVREGGAVWATGIVLLVTLDIDFFFPVRACGTQSACPRRYRKACVPNSIPF